MPAEPLHPPYTPEPPLGCGCVNARTEGASSLPCGLDQERALEWLEDRGGPMQLKRSRGFDIGEAPQQRCYRVMSGLIRLTRISPDGRRRIVRFVFAGGVFGLSTAEHALRAEAVSDAFLLHYPTPRLKGLAECNPFISREILATTLETSSAALDHVVLLGRPGATERVAGFLCLLHGRTGIGNLLKIPMSRLDIADFLGLTVETVSRTLTALMRRGALHRTDQRSVLCLDFGQLQQLASGL